MGLISMIEDYLARRASRKDREKEVYEMLVNGIELISEGVSASEFDRGDNLITKAQELIKSYGIHSRRVKREIRNALFAYSET